MLHILCIQPSNRVHLDVLTWSCRAQRTSLLAVIAVASAQSNETKRNALGEKIGFLKVIEQRTSEMKTLNKRGELFPHPLEESFRFLEHDLRVLANGWTRSSIASHNEIMKLCSSCCWRSRREKTENSILGSFKVHFRTEGAEKLKR